MGERGGLTSTVSIRDGSEMIKDYFVSDIIDHNRPVRVSTVKMCLDIYCQIHPGKVKGYVEGGWDFTQPFSCTPVVKCYLKNLECNGI